MAQVFSRILCPIDFERGSMDALEVASRLARQNSATVCLLTVIGAPPAAATALPPVQFNPDPEFEAACARRLEAIAREKLKGASHEVFVTNGNAAQEILKCAGEQKVDLIVMGTHGRTGLKHFILGSVAERVVRESPVPVLTVRPRPAT